MWRRRNLVPLLCPALNVNRNSLSHKLVTHSRNVSVPIISNCNVAPTYYISQCRSYSSKSIEPAPDQEKLLADYEDKEAREFEEKVDAFIARTGIQFQNRQLVVNALTHTSWDKTDLKLFTNQALEFFGDRLLGFALSNYFMRKSEYTNGRIIPVVTALSTNDHLFDVGSGLGLQDVVRFRGDKADDRWKKSVVAGAVEALLGAIYLDAGDNAAMDFITRFILPERVKDFEVYARKKNARKTLQFLLERKGDAEPQYKILEESGRLSHSSVFVVGVFVNGKQLGHGTARSIKEASNIAAQQALSKWGDWESTLRSQ
eukprot:TRINITY_DN5433_c0_g1_i1.p1 TRINITY_DN5433_c0_g1~~TRINITY_DN5433_c0_g1_i1.p1  ORF type:complete len:327 (+),score=69.68 TRINITY_DN5433_c0_g1_i1:34-981(+)